MVPGEDVLFEGTVLEAGTSVPIIQSQQSGTEQMVKLSDGAGVRKLLSLRCKDAKDGMVSRIWGSCRANMENRQRFQTLKDHSRGRQ